MRVERREFRLRTAEPESPPPYELDVIFRRLLEVAGAWPGDLRVATFLARPRADRGVGVLLVEGNLDEVVPGAVLRPGYDTTYWKKLLEHAGIPHTRRYTTRHTAISHALADGGDPASVAEMAGHSSTALTLSTYSHAIEERKLALAAASEQRYRARLEAAETP